MESSRQSAWTMPLAYLAGSAGVVVILARLLQAETVLALAGVVAVGSLAWMCSVSPRLRGLAFSMWVFAFVAAALGFPRVFVRWGDYETRGLIVPLIQVIMFGMGTMLSLADFARVLKLPKAVLVGIGLQFAIMPALGALLAATLQLPDAVAAGVVLIGACPGGVASNVMTYLSRGNVALSVTMTACSTLLSPLLTPLAMTLLAGAYVQIDFLGMMWSIFKMVIVPIGLGLIANRSLRYLDLRGAWLDRLLSLLAMGAICLIIAIITSLSRDELLRVGVPLILAAVIHNLCGYGLGYGGARLAGLPIAESRTVAIEVGLQNGGMASGLAVNVLGNADTALAPAIFGPWMNISGSMLASWWRKRPPTDSQSAPAS